MVKNEELFTGIANIYSNYRSTYPAELIDYLYSQVGLLDGSVIADIGSGTGKLAHLMMGRGSSVYCVEPNDDMRQIAESEFRKAGLANLFFSVKATAENTGLREESIDYVTVAQAFHWFKKESFKLECRRILRNKGKVILIWNYGDFEFEIIKKTFMILQQCCVGIQDLVAREIQKRDVCGFFYNEEYDTRVFKNDIVLNRESYIGMYLSGAYSPREKKNPDKYYRLVECLDELFDEHSADGVINHPQLTIGYIGLVGK